MRLTPPTVAVWTVALVFGPAGLPAALPRPAAAEPRDRGVLAGGDRLPAAADRAARQGDVEGATSSRSTRTPWSAASPARLQVGARSATSTTPFDGRHARERVRAQLPVERERLRAPPAATVTCGRESVRRERRAHRQRDVVGRGGGRGAQPQEGAATAEPVRSGRRLRSARQLVAVPFQPVQVERQRRAARVQEAADGAVVESAAQLDAVGHGRRQVAPRDLEDQPGIGVPRQRVERARGADPVLRLAQGRPEARPGDGDAPVGDRRERARAVERRQRRAGRSPQTCSRASSSHGRGERGSRAAATLGAQPGADVVAGRGGPNALRTAT